MAIGGKVLAGKLLDDLKSIVDDLPEAVDQGEEDLASAIAVAARNRAASLGSVHSHVQAGISSHNDKVELDVMRFPMILGAEFGGGGQPRTRQFPPHKGNTGYMLFPEVQEHDDDEIEEYFGNPIDEVID